MITECYRECGEIECIVVIFTYTRMLSSIYIVFFEITYPAGLPHSPNLRRWPACRRQVFGKCSNCRF